MHLLIASEASYIILIALYTVCSHEIYFVSCKKSRTIIQLELLGITIHTLQLLCRITFTPTVQHCSMATVTGLCLRLKLMQNPRDYTTGRWPAPQQADPRHHCHHGRDARWDAPLPDSLFLLVDTLCCIDMTSLCWKTVHETIWRTVYWNCCILQLLLIFS